RGGGGGAAGFETFTDMFEDLFGDFMGGRNRNPNRAQRGPDLRYNIEISLEDAFKGKKATIRVPGAVPCEPCGGSGAEAGSKPQTCPTCSGSGKVHSQQGFFSVLHSCPTCRGNGRIIKNPCRTCQGAGRVQKERTLNVSIPQGIEEGTPLRMTGEGEAGARGGPRGD
ncbi:MAG TPA: molecular chaperone DnaJ, partial [Alphaproteobacteria bacterium]|nr:molecular chaperone DnaJ [Alphaproteobacteria bacterium]